jgi:hypothetical protein
MGLLCCENRASLFCTVALLLLSGCGSVRYVPVETVKTEKVTETDTIIQKDTVRSEKETVIREARPEDSVIIARLGIRLRENERLLILLQKELSEQRSNAYESHRDTVLKTDSIRVPYPVERELTWWERQKIAFGEWVFGVMAVLLLVVIIRKRK